MITIQPEIEILSTESYEDMLSFFRYADNYSYGKAFDKQTATNRIGVFTKRRSTTGWNTSRRVSGISNGSMRRTNAK